jgi:hypothetical protein
MKEQILQALSSGNIPFALFLIWSAASVVVGLVRFLEYYFVQRVPSMRFFAAVNICQGIALGLAAVVIAPHPLSDYEHLRPWSRLWWAIGLVPFLIAVPLHIHYVGNVIWGRYKVWIIGPVDSGQKLQESHQNTATTGDAEQATE